ncbi:cell division protein FtsL [Candidatus Hydrogenosomobacter endosymbioticus]|uniref:Cell division protein FtsL n=1 Tax=Candidatus Hydrogenosomobacter endosymbioticus TaxID=2558174 RepID=A0ABM7V9U5_9PROT|nr:hypothetical protein [Candidatus Hydrogenosomobacter endosymbioticus]BDB96238.1 hypothetical protein HYD_3710 [Candidatus Hydrogenosomobacter endosymbioticus]
MRVLLLIVLALAGFSGGFLFYVKHEVLALESNIKNMHTMISKTRENIGTMQAELAYLTNPKRVAKLSKRYLADARPVENSRVLSVGNVRTVSTISGSDDKAKSSESHLESAEEEELLNEQGCGDSSKEAGNEDIGEKSARRGRGR